MPDCIKSNDTEKFHRRKIWKPQQTPNNILMWKRTVLLFSVHFVLMTSARSLFLLWSPFSLWYPGFLCSCFRILTHWATDPLPQLCIFTSKVTAIIYSSSYVTYTLVTFCADTTKSQPICLGLPPPAPSS